MNHLQHGNASKKVDLFNRQTGNQAINEITLDVARAGRQLLNGSDQVWALFDRRQLPTAARAASLL